MQIASVFARIEIDIFAADVRPPDGRVAGNGFDFPHVRLAQRGIHIRKGVADGFRRHPFGTGQHFDIRAVAVDALRRGGDAQRQPADEQHRAQHDGIPNDQHQPQSGQSDAADAEKEEPHFATVIQRGDLCQLVLNPPDGTLRPRRRVLRHSAALEETDDIPNAGVDPPDKGDKRQRQGEPDADGGNQAAVGAVRDMQRNQEKQRGVEHEAKPLETDFGEHKTPP